MEVIYYFLYRDGGLWIVRFCECNYVFGTHETAMDAASAQAREACRTGRKAVVRSPREDGTWYDSWNASMDVAA